MIDKVHTPNWKFCELSTAVAEAILLNKVSFSAVKAMLCFIVAMAQTQPEEIVRVHRHGWHCEAEKTVAQCINKNKASGRIMSSKVYQINCCKPSQPICITLPSSSLSSAPWLLRRSCPCLPAQKPASRPAPRGATVPAPKTSNAFASKLYERTHITIHQKLIIESNASFNIDFVNCVSEACEADDV